MDIKKAIMRNRELKSEITKLQALLRKKNLALDAIGYVWCSGGCSGGVFRWADNTLTREQVELVEQNTARLRQWYEASLCRKAQKSGEKMTKCEGCESACFANQSLNSDGEKHAAG